MADETPPGQPVPLVQSALTEAFGFMMGGELPPSVPMKLQNATDVLANSQALIQQNLTQRWAGAAVATDMLAGQAAYNLGGRLNTAADTLATLQQPVTTQLVGTLGEVYGATIPLGTNLDNPDDAAKPPACVQIRSAAAAGDFGPAIECYRATAFPRRFSGGTDYIQALNFITDSLPDTQAARDTWSTLLFKMQNEPESLVAGPVSPVLTAATVPAYVPQPPPETPNFGAPVSPGVVAAPATGTVTGSTGGRLPNCADINGKSYDDAVAFLGPPGAFNQLGSINGLPWGYSWNAVGPFTAAGCGAIITPQGITGLQSITCQLSTCPPSMIPVPVPPPQTGIPGTEPGTSPGTTPPPTIPETPKPPAPPPPKDCIKLCPTETPTCKYQLVCSSDHILYIIKDTDKPRSRFDKVVASGDPAGWNVDKIARDCNMRSPPSEETPPQIPAPVAGLAPVAGCDNLFRWQQLTEPLPGNFFTQLMLNGIQALGPITGCSSDLLCDALTGGRNGLLQLFGKLLDTFASGQALLGPLNCSGTPNEALVIGARTLVGLVNRYVSSAAEPADTSLAYAQNSLCPFRLPTPGEAGTAYLGNTIDAERLRCIVEANGNRWDSFRPVVDASRSKLGALQYGTLRMREKITQQEYLDRLRDSGFIRDYDAQQVLDLLKVLPPPGDIIRMMVRDSADDALAADFGLDQQFTDKFKGDLKSWAEQQGMPLLYMQYLWRAHWEIPSPTQLAEMYNRLSRLPPDDPAYVSRDIVKRVLNQQDIAPFWTEKFLRIAERPLTRIDARRAYEVGAMDDAGLIEAYRVLGYNQENAQRLLTFNKVQATLKFARHPAVKQYAKGELSGAELDDTLTAYGATPEYIQFARLQASRTMNALRRSRCLMSLHRRFLIAELDPPDTLEAIRSQGLDPEQAQSILDGWQCERDARGKAIPAGELCTMYEQGIITISDLTSRMQRLGFSYDDSILMARKCAQRVQDKITREEQKRLRQQEADQRKYLNQSLRNTAAGERQRQAQIKAAARMQRLKLAQTKRIQEAGLNVSKHFGISLPDGVATVETLLENFLGNTLYTRDEIIQALLVESRSDQAVNLETLTAAVAAALPV